MPGIARNTIIQGPCQITYATFKIWSKGDVVVKPIFDSFDIETSAWGKVDTRLRSKRYEVTFEPDGRVNSNLIGVFWPWAASAVGTSLFGSADKILIINGRDGVQVQILNAAITQMPAIRMGVGVTFAGTCKFTGLIALNKAVSAADAYTTISSVTYPAETGWAASDILTQAALCTWGSAPWTAFQVDSPGWEITPTMRLQNITVDNLGVVDMTLQGMEVTAKAVPVGPTAAEILTAMSATGELGSSIGSGTELVISSGSTPKAITVTVYNAALTDSQMVWGAAKKRVSQCTWEACRTVTTGVSDPLFAVAIA